MSTSGVSGAALMPMRAKADNVGACPVRLNCCCSRARSAIACRPASASAPRRRAALPHACNSRLDCPVETPVRRMFCSNCTSPASDAPPAMPSKPAKPSARLRNASANDLALAAPSFIRLLRSTSRFFALSSSSVRFFVVRVTSWSISRSARLYSSASSLSVTISSSMTSAAMRHPVMNVEALASAVCALDNVFENKVPTLVTAAPTASATSENRPSLFEMVGTS